MIGSRDAVDERVTIDQVPAAARATIEANLGGGTINEVERSSRDGKVWYEVEVKGDDGMFDIAVAEDGAYLGMDDDGPDDDDGPGDDDDDGDDDDRR